MKKKYIDLLKYLSIQNSASTSNEIAIESVELAHEGIKRIKP